MKGLFAILRKGNILSPNGHWYGNIWLFFGFLACGGFMIAAIMGVLCLVEKRKDERKEYGEDPVKQMKLRHRQEKILQRWRNPYDPLGIARYLE